MVNHGYHTGLSPISKTNHHFPYHFSHQNRAPRHVLGLILITPCSSPSEFWVQSVNSGFLFFKLVIYTHLSALPSTLWNSIISYLCVQMQDEQDLAAGPLPPSLEWTQFVFPPLLPANHRSSVLETWGWAIWSFTTISSELCLALSSGLSYFMSEHGNAVSLFITLPLPNQNICCNQWTGRIQELQAKVGWLRH